MAFKKAMVSAACLSGIFSCQALLIPTGAAAASWVTGAQASLDDYNICVDNGHFFLLCGDTALIVDPPASGVNGFTLQIRFDPSKYIFDPASSGPLGVFSVGGDSPAPTPGSGLSPFKLLPATGFNAGSPLPGSTLTYTVVGDLLTVDYQLQNALTVDGDINFFRLDFALIHPAIVKLDASSVTYLSSGAGQDFTQVRFSCSTTSTNSCGSATPSTGLTITYGVPEPATWAMFIGGLGLLGGVMRRQRRSHIRYS